MAGGYRFAPWPDTNFQRSAMNEDNMNAVFDTYIRLPLSQIVPDNGWVASASSQKIRLNRCFTQQT